MTEPWRRPAPPGAAGPLGWVVLAALLAALAVAAVAAPLAVGSALRPVPASSLLLRGAAWAALALASFATAMVLRPRLGRWAPWCVAVLVFASATWAMVLWQPIPVMVGCAVALAYALMIHVPSPRAAAPEAAPEAGDSEAAQPPAQMYGGDLVDDAPAISWLRWLGAGALLAVPAVWHPAFLFLLLGGLVATPLAGRRRAATAFVFGVLLLLGPGVGLSGGLDRWSADLHAPLFDLHLLGWNLVWSAIGRQTGALVFFLPLVIALFADLSDRFTQGVLGSVALSWIALVLLRPFDWLLAPTLLAAPSFLALYVPLWFLPGRSVRPLVLLGVSLPALALLFPLWRAPLAVPIGSDGAARSVSPWLAGLPVEATQRDLPGVRDAQSGALRVRLLDGAAWTESVGALRMQGNRAIELLLVSVDELPAVAFEFGARATPRVVVEGATIGDTAFRPDGRVGFELRLDHPTARVPMWWSPSRQSVYRLTLRLENGPPEPIPFTLRPGPLRRKPE